MLSTATVSLIVHLATTSPTAPPLPGRHAPTAPAARPAEVDRLASWIVKINPKATRWARRLSVRINLEARRHTVPVEAMAAIAWIESDYQRRLDGASRELGLWQLRAVAAKIPTGWRWIRNRPAEFPIVARVGAGRSWRRLPARGRRAVLEDIRAGTYLAALEINSARYTCYRMRNKAHRVGTRWRSRSHWYAHRRPGRRLDVFAHYNSGPRPPLPNYRRKLRRRACLIAAHLAARPASCPGRR